MKVFVCDDEIDILDFMEIMLTDFGHEVCRCSKHDEVIDTILEFQPDIILMDYWLNGVKSDKIIKNIKRDRRIKDIPLILVSAAGNIYNEISDIGIDDYIQKPFDMYDFHIKLKKFSTISI
jgi:DNA-binding response OmpR family regulator